MKTYFILFLIILLSILGIMLKKQPDKIKYSDSNHQDPNHKGIATEIVQLEHVKNHAVSVSEGHIEVKKIPETDYINKDELDNIETASKKRIDKMTNEEREELIKLNRESDEEAVRKEQEIKQKRDLLKKETQSPSLQSEMLIGTPPTSNLSNSSK